MFLHLFAVDIVSVHLEQFGVQQQSVGSLGVVVAFFVEVTQLVQVPGRKKQWFMGHVWLGLSHINNRQKVNSARLMRLDRLFHLK